MKEFVEVLTDFEDEDGNQYIDCFTTDDVDEGGVNAGYVTPDGQFVRGQYVSDEQLNQDLVQEVINEVIEEKLTQKQQVVQEALFKISRNLFTGDMNGTNELMMCIPFEKLVAYLPEE